MEVAAVVAGGMGSDGLDKVDNNSVAVGLSERGWACLEMVVRKEGMAWRNAESWESTGEVEEEVILNIVEPRLLQMMEPGEGDDTACLEAVAVEPGMVGGLGEERSVKSG